jgi:hypothetical protein
VSIPGLIVTLVTIVLYYYYNLQLCEKGTKQLHCSCCAEDVSRTLTDKGVTHKLGYNMDASSFVVDARRLYPFLAILPGGSTVHGDMSEQACELLIVDMMLLRVTSLVRLQLVRPSGCKLEYAARIAQSGIAVCKRNSCGMACALVRQISVR